MAYKVLLIYNPTAGPWDMTRTLNRLASYLQGHGWQIELATTEQAGDATWYAQQAARSAFDLVLVAGGDGTINEVANGMAGSNTAMGIVPAGTGNILAHQIRMPLLSVVMPLHVSEVGDALLAGRIHRADLGTVNGRYFVCWAGAGLDAEITVHMEPRARIAKRFSTIPYLISGFAVASEYRGVRARIAVEGRTFTTRALLILASNIQQYAAFFTVARHAYMDDGLLDIFVFKGLGFGYALRHFFHLFSGRYLRDPSVIQILSRRLQIETTPIVAIHRDGDPMGDTPALIGIAPGALRLLVPPQSPGDLFCNPPEHILKG